MARLETGNLEDYQQRLDNLILSTRFLFSIQEDEKDDQYLASRSDCYDLDKECELVVLRNKLLEVPRVQIRDPHIGHYRKVNDFLRLIFYVGVLEQEAVRKLLTESALETKDKNYALGRRILLAHRSVTYKNVRDYLASGNLDLNNLRHARALRYLVSSNQVGTALSEVERKYDDVIHFVGSRYLLVGYVSVDSNYLRKYLWNYSAYNVADGGELVQEVSHRQVIILYDLRDKQFVIQSAPARTDVFFDDYSDEIIEDYLTYETTEYKDMEMKTPSQPSYTPECTRVFNGEEEFQNMKQGETYVFALETFLHRYKHRIPFGITDDEIKESKDRFCIYPISYSVLIYSIIRTWLHQYSRNLSDDMYILPYGAEPYFLCYYDPVVGALTNSFQRGHPGLLRKRIGSIIPVAEAGNPIFADEA